MTRKQYRLVTTGRSNIYDPLLLYYKIQTKIFGIWLSVVEIYDDSISGAVKQFEDYIRKANLPATKRGIVIKEVEIEMESTK